MTNGSNGTYKVMCAPPAHKWNAICRPKWERETLVGSAKMCVRKYLCCRSRWQSARAYLRFLIKSLPRVSRYTVSILNREPTDKVRQRRSKLLAVTADCLIQFKLFPAISCAASFVSTSIELSDDRTERRRRRRRKKSDYIVKHRRTHNIDWAPASTHVSILRKKLPRDLSST